MYNQVNFKVKFRNFKKVLKHLKVKFKNNFALYTATN